jgi:hypothetical protein
MNWEGQDKGFLMYSRHVGFAIVKSVKRFLF